MGVDRTLRLWAANGKPLAIYTNDAAFFCCVAQNPTHFVIGDATGHVVFLELRGSATI